MSSSSSQNINESTTMPLRQPTYKLSPNLNSTLLNKSKPPKKQLVIPLKIKAVPYYAMIPKIDCSKEEETQASITPRMNNKQYNTFHDQSSKPPPPPKKKASNITSKSARDDKNPSREGQQFKKKLNSHRLSRIPKKLRRLFRRHQKQLAFEDEIEQIRGVKQPNVFHDFPFAVIFIIQIIAVVWIAATYGIPLMVGISSPALTPTVNTTSVTENDHDDNNIAEQSSNKSALATTIIQLSCICGAYACLLSGMTIGFIMILARSFIQSALIFSMCMSFAWGMVGMIAMPSTLVPVLGAVIMVTSIGYTFVVWDRIPFVTANLNAALTGIRANPSLIILTVLVLMVTFLWFGCWIVAYIGIQEEERECNSMGRCRTMVIIAYTTLYFSFLWTFQVIKNVLQVAASGTIANWWFNPQKERCCIADSAKVSLISSMTYSFGSICFGSLFVWLAHTTQAVAEQLCNRKGSILSCLQEYVITRTDRFIEYFNRWSFAYIGLYGYPYIDSARNIMAIFKRRKWTEVISDSLINNMLLMGSIVISLSSGCFSLLTLTLYEYNFSSFARPEQTAFFIGAGIGFVLSSVLFSLISSSVNTIIVCFATGQNELRANHQKLGNQMRDAWRTVWSDNIV